MSPAARVLVVDDSQSVRRAIGRMLAPRGLTVAEAPDGRQALDRLAEERPDLVISDVVLPGLDGYEVCRFVRRRPGLAGVPVLLISGLCSPEVERRAVAAGAAGVLAKPFTAEALVARVEAVLAAASAAPDGADEMPADELPAGELPAGLAAGLAEMRGLRAAWLLDADAGGARRIGGGGAPAEILELLRRAADLTAELGFGVAQGLTLEGDDGTIVVERCGPTAIAARFDRHVLLGLARHQIRQLCRRAPRPTHLPEGARDGDRPR